jgi:hypothetical protein
LLGEKNGFDAVMLVVWVAVFAVSAVAVAAGAGVVAVAGVTGACVVHAAAVRNMARNISFTFISDESEQRRRLAQFTNQHKTQNMWIRVNSTSRVRCRNSTHRKKASMRLRMNYGRTSITLAVAMAAVSLTVPANGTPSCTPAENSIVAENLKTGSPKSEWDLDDNICVEAHNTSCRNGPAYIQGFAKEISVNRGEQIDFKVRITGIAFPVAFKLDIYRMGYYAGNGARKVATVNSQQTTAQPACGYDVPSGNVDCGNWSINASWDGKENGVAVPSGIYFAKLTSSSVTGASHIVFIIRNDTGCADLLFQTSDTTWQAYNIFGGGRGLMNLYFRDADWVAPTTPSPASERIRAFKVSYNRPFNSRGGSVDEGGPHSWVFHSDYPLVRWLEANGYNVSYSTGVDTDRSGAELLEHRAFVSVGHDEYWSGTQRTNVEVARNAGVHIAVFSGNEVFWKTRWEDNHHTLVSYKESHSAAHIDPDPTTWTGTWRDPRFSPPLDGGRPENALLGNIFTTNNQNNERAVTVSQEDGQLRFWRNTPAATQSPGATLSLAAATLGYEYDTDVDNGFRPAGLIRISTTMPPVPQNVNTHKMVDNYLSYEVGEDIHHITLYRHAAGALVFSAGTIQWSWGLDCHHDRGDSCYEYDHSATERQNFQTMRQATVNIFADMGVQPATLMAGLSLASASNDFVTPTSIITAPSSGASVAKATVVTITGTASDSGGGIVGGVEVSVDGGAHWHPVTSGRATWSYSWTPSQSGAAQIRSRAVDDSGNLEVPSTGRTVSVIGTPSLGAPFAVPGIIQAEDFDNGGEGVAYHDTTSGNSGNSTYRSTDVDISQCPTGTSCGRLIGYVKATEWLDYTINVATTGIYDFAVHGSYGFTTGLFHIEIDGVDKTGSMTIAPTGDSWIVKATYKAGVSLTAGPHVLRIVVDQEPGWLGNFDFIRISRAYNATAIAIPGSFEAEDFNEGGEGVSYHDTTTGNSGGAYRSTDVDISQCPTGTSCGGLLIGYVKATEWLEYSINVATTGIYDFAVHGSYGFTTGLFHIEIDGVDKTGSMTIAPTGDSWIVKATYKAGVSLTAGPHVLRIVVDQEPGWLGNFDFIRISRAYNATAIAIPGSFEAEDFNEGGEVVSYHDTTTGNSGGAYRSTDVDISQCPTGTLCGRLIGYVKAGEWLEYSVNVATTGNYTLTLYGSGGYVGGAFHVEIDGVDKTGAMSVAETGDIWVTATTTKTGVSLTAGAHVLRIAMDQDAAHGWVGNFDKLTITGPN